ncbi:hypothetical protein MBGDN05_00778 [Thermoplasmatales archaeon SCGC AB-539-N05]|nr:hypothetical protein MBGDN05_00778 [Thermoplasmatales archaeon SCGC AB-539-N05]
MKKKILIGIIIAVALMLFMPLVSSMQIQSTSISEEPIDELPVDGPRYEVTAMTRTHYSIYHNGNDLLDEESFLFAKITGEVSFYSYNWGVHYFVLEDEQDYLTIKPLFREEITYTAKGYNEGGDRIKILAVAFLPFIIQKEI